MANVYAELGVQGLKAVQDPGTRNFARETHNFGFGVVKTLVLIPFIIVSIILLIAALIAIGNGAYTMGTFITFLIGGAMLYGCYWVISGAGSIANEHVEPHYAPQQQYYQPSQQYYPPQQYQQQYARPQGYGNSPRTSRSIPQSPNVPRLNLQSMRPTTGYAEDSDIIN